jgi:hypothetical protein
VTSVYLEGALVRALQLAAEPMVLAHLDEAEYAALEDAERLQTTADIERVTANIDEAAAAAARSDAERIREERLVTERALAAADEAAARIEADLHDRAAGQARAIADGARRSREAHTEASRRTIAPQQKERELRSVSNKILRQYQSTASSSNLLLANPRPEYIDRAQPLRSVCGTDLESFLVYGS